MKPTLIVIAVIAILLSVAFAAKPLYNPADDNITFEQFLKMYPQDTAMLMLDSYDLAAREQIFEMNMQTIRNHNKRYAEGKETWTMKVNQFGAMTTDEVMAKFTGYDRAQAASNPLRHVNPLKKTNLKAPNFEPIDWSEWVDTIHQGSCGSCWAHGATLAFAGRLNMMAGQKLPLPSRQSITSCAPNTHKCGGTGGCKGSTAQLAWDYVIANGGITTEEEYPYVSGETKDTELCYDHKYKPKYTIGSYESVLPNDREAFIEALKDGPISVSVAASEWHFYSSGIMSGKACADYTINHVVTGIGIGYDSTVNMYYYLLKNSWGTTWGENGSIKLYMAPPNEEEICAIDPSPYSGSGCQDDPNPRVLACACSGLLHDSNFVVDPKVLN